MPAYLKAGPPSTVVRGEELQDLFRAVKGAFHDLVSSLCTSGKNGTGGGRWEPAQPQLRNHSSSLEGAGCGGGFHTSPTFSAARESIAIISGSGSDNATTPEGGNAAGSSSPERESSPSDAAMDIWSSGGAPKETGGVPCSAEVPARSNGHPTGCGVLEGWWTPLEEALTVTLKSPLTPLDTAESITQLRNGNVPTRNMNHPRKLPQCAECQTREAVIVTVLRHQEMTTPRNARVIRHL